VTKTRQLYACVLQLELNSERDSKTVNVVNDATAEKNTIAYLLKNKLNYAIKWTTVEQIRSVCCVCTKEQIQVTLN